MNCLLNKLAFALQMYAAELSDRCGATALSYLFRFMCQTEVIEGNHNLFARDWSSLVETEPRNLIHGDIWPNPSD